MCFLKEHSALFQSGVFSINVANYYNVYEGELIYVIYVPETLRFEFDPKQTELLPGLAMTANDRDVLPGHLHIRGPVYR